jgi:hypothetical protein
MTVRSLTRGMSAVFVSIVLSGTWAVRGQCTKDTDCKGDRICVKGVCTAPGQNASSAQPSSQQNSEAVSQPSEAEVKACVAALEGLGGMYGSVLRVEYGAPMSSQGGMTEMDLGAPKGTSIYPVRLRFHDYRTAEAWLYRDPFGTLKCARHGNVEYAPPTTPEEMSAAIKDGETVRVPVKLFSGYAPNMHFVAGTLAVSTKSLVLTAPESTGFTLLWTTCIQLTHKIGSYIYAWKSKIRIGTTLSGRMSTFGIRASSRGAVHRSTAHAAVTQCPCSCR